MDKARVARTGFGGRTLRCTLLVLAVAMVVPSFAAAQNRVVYVSDGFPAGNNDVHG